MTKIKELPLEERPIEKLRNHGASTLSNEELLAILMNTGTKEKSVKELAVELLKKSGGLSKLKDMRLNTLLEIHGIGFKKASVLLAMIELSKRINLASLEFGHQINSCEDVASYFKQKFQDETQEHFYCIYLDQAKKMVDLKLLFIGTLNFSCVHPREVFKNAYLNNATSMILVHNHPSGNVTPSKSDIDLTEHLKAIGDIHGIKIEDHIIIGKNMYYSFFEKKCFVL